MLEVKDLSVFYDNVQVLWGISLSVPEKSIVALVGANGAGKTTLLNSICGVARQREGSITLNGQRIDALPTKKIIPLGITLVPEGRHLFPEMSVHENLLMGGYVQPESLDGRIEEALEMFPELRGKLRSKAATLSGGQQQMLTVARSLLSQPKVMLFDEPSQGLSPLYQQKIFELISRLPSLGISALVVEQYVDRVLDVADTAFVLRHGRVALHGSASDVAAAPELRSAYLGL
ncbi:MAG: ABC transporter ATP-binding protein [Nitrososphaerota archaeon]|nr:ABC transporter ATP-binding protein [Nitrososphaerota archaeon]